jgi:hypothetical protein
MIPFIAPTVNPEPERWSPGGAALQPVAWPGPTSTLFKRNNVIDFTVYDYQAI